MNTLKKIALVSLVAGFALAGNVVRADEHEGAAAGGTDTAVTDTAAGHEGHEGHEKPMKKKGMRHAKKEKAMKKAHKKTAEKAPTTEEGSME